MVSASRVHGLGVLALVAAVGALGVDAAHAGRADKACVKTVCKPQKRACAAAFKGLFQVVRGACPDRKCRTAAKRRFRQDRKRCARAFKACRGCCTRDAGACAVEVLGDGLCAGAPRIEQCDGSDDAACPGQCRTDCTCPGSPDDPGGNAVGEISAARAVVVVVDASRGSQAPFRRGEGFLITAEFGTEAPVAAPPTERIGSCTIARFTEGTTDLGAGGFMALDAGAAGVARVGSSRVELLPSASGAGSLEPNVSPPELLGRGFDAGATVDFEFPGGDDIGGFTTAVQIPPALRLTAPDVEDPGLRLDFSGPLELAWSGGSGSGTIEVVLTTLAVPEVNPPATEAEAAIVTCTLPDTGRATIAAEVLSRVPDDTNVILLAVARTRRVDVPVPLTRGGRGTVVVGGASAVLWTFSDVDVVTPRR
jgi:hypothetical protein